MKVGVIGARNVHPAALCFAISDMSRFLALKFRENVTLGFNFSSIDTGSYHQLIYRDVFQLYFLQPTGRNVPLLTSLREILYLKINL